MNKVLVSACLLGKRVRYDGGSLAVADRILAQWLAEGRVVSVCPEVDAGMSIPRRPAEIVEASGRDVLLATAKVLDNAGEDVTAYFISGAEQALATCQKQGLRVAVLAESSPSCGSHSLYDGHFSGNKVPGEGVTAALLRQNGIDVYSQFEIEAAHKTLIS